LFVRLHAHTPGHRPVRAGDALKALLREIGVDPGQIPRSLGGRERLWRDRLAGKRVLLLLDDAASHRQVHPLIPGTAGCGVMVTSRRRLAALEGAVPVPLDVMRPDQADLLFNRLCGRAGSDPEATARLMQLAGHLPLAIRLLAGRLRHHPSWTVGHLAGELAAARDRSVAIGASDESVSAAFALSYNRLPGHRQRFFRYLGLHPGTDIDAYLAAALSGLDLEGARGELDALFSDHLIDEPSRGRYRFHDLIGDFARALARVSAPQDHAAAIERLMNYYLHTAQAADQHLSMHARDTPGPPPAPPDLVVPSLTGAEDAAAWMSAERTNLHAAADYAWTNGSFGYVIGISAAMNGYLRVHGHWHEAVTLHSIALTAARRQGDTQAEASALVDLGTVQYQTGDFPAAAASLDQALRLFDAASDRLGYAKALLERGYVLRLTGDSRTAVVSFSEALDIYRALGNRNGQANALNDLGYAQILTDDFPSATLSLSEAIDLYRAAGNDNGQANALNYLGVVQYQTGDHRAAFASQREALRLYRALGNRNGQANALNYLGRSYFDAGRFRAASVSFAEALALYRLVGNRLGEANALRDFSRIQQAAGEIRAATATADQALELHRSLGDRLGEANTLNLLGTLQCLTNDYSTARATFRRALELYRAVGERNGEAETLNNLGELSMAAGATAQAHDCHREALDIARRITAPAEEARALEGIGRCQLRRGRSQQARASLRQALVIYQDLGWPAAQAIESLLQDHNY
jgi:tetratricopeptide (TPR) repeat protein